MNTAKTKMNSQVRVKLRPSGMRIHYLAHLEFAQQMATDHPYAPPQIYKPPVVDEEGYTTFSLWALMQMFGPHIHMTMEPPFAETIIVETVE